MPIVTPTREKAWQRKRREHRDELWPDAQEVICQPGRSPAYCKLVPRTVSLVCTLVSYLKARAGDLTATYLDLWLRTDADGFVEVEDEHECAASAGFLGGRALWSWRERVRALQQLGLIRYKGEGRREISYILVLNPEPAVEDLLKTAKGAPSVWLDYYRKRQRDIAKVT